MSAVSLWPIVTAFLAGLALGWLAARRRIATRAETPAAERSASETDDLRRIALETLLRANADATAPKPRGPGAPGGRA